MNTLHPLTSQSNPQSSSESVAKSLAESSDLSSGPNIDPIAQALNWSLFLQRRLSSRPELQAQWHEDIQAEVNPQRILTWFEQLGGSLTAMPPADNADCRRQVRQLRQRIFSTLLIRDIAGLASFEEVTQSMSFLADLVIQAAYRSVMHTLVEAHGAPLDPLTGLPMEMIVLGMGKLGGEELNVSSDIDLIMLYGDEGETQGRRPLSYHEFYGRLTQRMMPIISDPDADGFVFRTDLRLRPDGDSGPLAWSLDALENYLITQGREWERYAWIKARVIELKYFPDSDPSSDIHALESIRTPFVYRKYFDFDALSSLRGLREQIRQDWQRRANARQGIETTQNVKLGEGGIREIEFIVQLIQLIRGGRMPSLQHKRLLNALQAEVFSSLMSESDAKQLEQAYRFLRRVEHMLQYRDDAQTHLLPSDPEVLQLLSQTMGFSVEAFEAQLQQHRQFVSHTFRNVFRLLGFKESAEESALNSGTTPVQALNLKRETIIEQEFTPESQAKIQESIESLFKSHRLRNLSEAHRERIKALIPSILLAAAKTDNPQQACFYLFDLIETIAQRSAYIALLAEYPEILQRVARLMMASPWTAQYLLQNPLLLDSLIDWRTLLEPVDIAGTAEQLRMDLDSSLIHEGEPDIERQMNLMRDAQKMVSFQLLAQDLEGELSVEALADYLSALADMLLEESLARTWCQLRKTSKYALPEKPKFAIIAYGKLGGKELGYASDLDLVLVFDDDSEHAIETYAKLGRRLSTWVSTMTSSGRMYELDMRLRPDGDAGLLAVTVEGFEKYQREHAWVWEHQALTRARFAAGNPQVGEQFEQIRRQILLLEREPEKLKDDIVEMRLKMRDGHPNHSELFDVKHDSGGMVDIEFITQYLVLAHAKDHAKLLENLGNIALLKIAGQAGLIPLDLAEQVSNAYRVLRKSQHAVRLRGEDKARVSQELLQDERKAVQELWQWVFPHRAYA